MTPDEREDELIRVDGELKALEARVKDLKRERAALQELIIDDFVQSGKQSVKKRGRTLYLHRELWIFKRKEASKNDACRALRRARLGELVSEGFSASSLSALMRERAEQGKRLLSPYLERFFEVDWRRQVKVLGNRQ